MPLMRRGGRPGLIGMAARTAVVAGTATAVSGRVARHQEAKAEEKYAAQQYEAQQAAADAAPPAPAYAPPPQAAYAPPPPQAAYAPPPPEPAAEGGSDLTSQLQQLAALHSQGILSEEEFAAAKAKLLS
ncbi:SHOCT domain-containing protein [Arthrobacter sp. I2-34]|uniref:SHOCT domain-containing protein n=1 Tax=Arthrobacter hankyongi TaxID=2904801 RepID=A0ABS9L399_9MICC|nr:SHOCT domain-containing protein [Arthrobacter hankyongi]MCG2620984.1 SHOCT domain-containing protein [Arthrobacter hankyongi]